MQRYLIALLFSISSLVYGALSYGTVWEVRTATGADTNGGGWVPGSSGTDYSQQTSPQYATTAAVTAGTTTITWAAAAAAMVGNLAYVVGGTGSITAGWYQVVSVSVGVSITVDRSTGLTTGTGVTVNVGGALATLTQAIASAISHNTIYCKGSQTITTQITFGIAGSVVTDSPFYIIGYTTTRGDNGRFTITTSTNSANGILYNSGANNAVFKNLLIQSTAGTPGNGIQTGTSGLSSNLTLDNCRIRGWSYGIWGPYSTQYYILFLTLNNTEIDHSVHAGIYNSAQTYILNSYLHDNVYGLQTNSAYQNYQGWLAVNSVFYNNSTAGVLQSGTFPGTAINCVFANNGTGVSLLDSDYTTASIINSIFYGNTTGISSSGSPSGVFKNNAFGANTTATSGLPTQQDSTITLTADPFTNRTGGDFTLNSTAGGGQLCKNAGFPGTAAFGIGSLSVGALQPSTGGGGSATTGFAIIQ